jgi:hypothetical protein
MLFQDTEAFEQRRLAELPDGGKRISNRGIIRAFKRSGLTPRELAWRLGYVNHQFTHYKKEDGTISKYGPFELADEARVRFKLGMLKTGHGKLQKQVTVRTALEFCRAMGLDPWEIGL